MPHSMMSLKEALHSHFNELELIDGDGELTAILPVERLLNVATELRDLEAFHFEQLVDLTAVDYLHYGQDE